MQFNGEVIEAAIDGFERQKRKIDDTIAELRSRLGSGVSARPGPKADPAPATKAKRTMSAATKKRMAAAQKARWAAIHADQAPEKSEPKPKPKRKLSRAARAKLVENLAKARVAGAAKRTAGGKVPF
jgi:hypothetical protein